MLDLPLSRREMLARSVGGFGALALAGLVAERAGPGEDPLAPRVPHFTPRVKRVIFLYMTGGVSHVDSFDPKPKLRGDHGKTLIVDNWQGKKGEFTRYISRGRTGSFGLGGRAVPRSATCSPTSAIGPTTCV